MSVVAFPFKRAQREEQLLVVFADLQREYASAGRRYAIQDLDGCLGACTDLLEWARRHRLTIAHFRQLSPDLCFNRTSPFADWIDGFRPRASEAVFERALPSIYSNADFCAYVESASDPTILMAGLSADRACLASAVDAHHRGHRLIFVEDCSACAPIADLTEVRSRELVTDVIGRFVDTTCSADVIGCFSEPRGSARKRLS